ncbi:hypothetical protein STRPS_0721 [Streptococcus pseudoporcinus LQ 940-04]|uniref:Uncharacterized protein n=1 Tax=Streptococcus pseudoporcinus LQ 940-04 TaxID=875093 RepID=G5K9H7_9STRE|nr:hypothetical protein HMPREF9320_1275 [Streptococcus pseudoporcinus SPIN 20026]EHI65409.1 hypothetical protein STRPS_0721 [Streptococcus pseudoporcinus LQ 940-04]
MYSLIVNSLYYMALFLIKSSAFKNYFSHYTETSPLALEKVKLTYFLEASNII